MAFRRLLLALLIATICDSPLSAAVVISDNFNRTGALTGSAPTINTGQTWTATDAFQPDGAKLFAEGSFLQPAYLQLPAPIQTGHVYRLSATTYFNVVSSDDLAYMMFGFFDSDPSYDRHRPLPATVIKIATKLERISLDRSRSFPAKR